MQEQFWQPRGDNSAPLGTARSSAESCGTAARPSIPLLCGGEGCWPWLRDFNTSQASLPAVPGENSSPASRKRVKAALLPPPTPCALQRRQPRLGGVTTGGKMPQLSAGTSPHCSPAGKPSLIPSPRCPSTGMSPGAGDSHYPGTATHLWVCPQPRRALQGQPGHG